MFPPHWVPSAQYSLIPMFPQPEILPHWYSLSHVFPHTDVASALCSLTPIFSALCSICPIFPLARCSLSPACIPLFMCSPALCSLSPMFLQPDITSAMCSLSLVFPKPDVPSTLHMVLQAWVSSAKYSSTLMLPQPVSPSACCSKLLLTTAMAEEAVVRVASQIRVCVCVCVFVNHKKWGTQKTFPVAASLTKGQGQVNLYLLREHVLWKHSAEGTSDCSKIGFREHWSEGTSDWGEIGLR